MGFSLPRGPIVLPREFIQEGSPLLNPDTADNPFGIVAEQVYEKQQQRVLGATSAPALPAPSSKRASKTKALPQPPPPISSGGEPPVPAQSSLAQTNALKPVFPVDSGSSGPIRTLSIVPSAAPGGGLTAVEVPTSALKNMGSLLAQMISDASSVATDVPRELLMHRIDFNPAQQLELKLINTLDVPSNALSITHLSLRDCELSPNFITRMYSVMTCFPSLTRLDISHCYIEKATARLLPGVAASLPNLTAFTATHTCMNDACSVHLRALLIACPRITTLNLDNNNMTAFGEDSMCDALTQVNTPTPGTVTRHHLSSRLFVYFIAGSGIASDPVPFQLITLTDRPLSRGVSAVRHVIRSLSFCNILRRYSAVSLLISSCVTRPYRRRRRRRSSQAFRASIPSGAFSCSLRIFTRVWQSVFFKRFSSSPRPLPSDGSYTLRCALAFRNLICTQGQRPQLFRCRQRQAGRALRFLVVSQQRACAEQRPDSHRRAVVADRSRGRF
jgi:hypothetical protein